MFEFDIESIISDINNETNLFIRDALVETENIITNIKAIPDDIDLEITNIIESISNEVENVTGSIEQTFKEIETELENIWSDIEGTLTSVWEDIEKFASGIWEDIANFFEGLEFLLYVIPIVVGVVAVGLVTTKILKIYLKVSNHRKLNIIYKNSQQQKRANKTENPLIKSWKSKFANIKNLISSDDYKKIINYVPSKLKQRHTVSESQVKPSFSKESVKEANSYDKSNKKSISKWLSKLTAK